MSLVENPGMRLITCAAVIAGAIFFLQAGTATNLYSAAATRSMPTVQAAPMIATQPFTMSRLSAVASDIASADASAFDDQVYAASTAAPSAVYSTGLAAICMSMALAAAGLGLRALSYFQSSPTPDQSFMEMHHTITMLATSGVPNSKAVKETRKKRVLKKKKSKPKKERTEAKVEIVRTTKEVFARMRKGVLRRFKKPLKTTGRICQLLGKVDNRQARAISFSHIRTRRVQHVNLHWRRLWWQEGKCFVLLRLSTKGIKTITKYGLHAAAIKFGLDLTKHINGTSERNYIKYLPEKEKALALKRGARLRERSQKWMAMLNDTSPVLRPSDVPSEPAAGEPAAEPAVIAMAISHGCKVPQLSKPADQRKALLRSLTTELIRHGRIKTTFIRAKAMRKPVDHMITLAKEGSLHARRQALAYLYDKDLVKTLFEQAPERYAQREGGYCRILRTMPRKGDSAKMCYIELV